MPQQYLNNQLNNQIERSIGSVRDAGDKDEQGDINMSIESDEDYQRRRSSFMRKLKVHSRNNIRNHTDIGTGILD